MEGDCNLEVNVLDSIDDVEERTNSGLDVNCSSIPGNCKISGSHHNIKVRKNTIQKLSVGGLIYNVSVGISSFKCCVSSRFMF